MLNVRDNWFLHFSDPTIKPGCVYREKVDIVGDTLSEVEKVSLDLIMLVMYLNKTQGTFTKVC